MSYKFKIILIDSIKYVIIYIIYTMTSINELKTHLKKFTVKELKKEVMKVKKQFQVFKLKRVDVERVILLYHHNFLHLLKIDKKKKPTVKKINTNKKQNKMKQPSVKNINTDKQQDYVTKYYTNLLNQLDEKAVGKRAPTFISDKHTNVIIQKSKTRYVVRNGDDGSVLLSTLNRKEVEDFLYKLINSTPSF